MTPEINLDPTNSSNFHQMGDFPLTPGSANDLIRSRNSTASNESFSSHAVKRNNFGNVGGVNKGRIKITQYKYIFVRTKTWTILSLGATALDRGVSWSE